MADHRQVSAGIFLGGRDLRQTGNDRRRTGEIENVVISKKIQEIVFKSNSLVTRRTIYCLKCGVSMDRQNMVLRIYFS